VTIGDELLLIMREDEISAFSSHGKIEKLRPVVQIGEARG